MSQQTDHQAKIELASTSEEPLCLLFVHAHPDDEASKGSGSAAKYASEGVRTVLVCCTGGEAGDILNPAVDTPEIRSNLAQVRREELAESVATLNFSALYLLGYHDSGMPGTETNARPDNFANAPLEEAVGRLVKIIRAEHPQVIVSYAEDRQFYPHPDHIRVYEVSAAAFDAAGNPDLYPEAGPAWQPLKLYHSSWSMKRARALEPLYESLGEESPFKRRFEHAPPDIVDSFTTLIDVGDFLDKKRDALLAHRTQVDPTGFWMRLPDDLVREVFPWEEFILARSLVKAGGSDETETDLFAGLR